MFAAPTAISPETPIDVSVRMTFTGAQEIAFLAFAKSTDASITGDWNYPSFGGGFLPVTRALPRDATTAPNPGEVVLKKGFRAEWKIPFIARGLPAVTDASTFASLGKSAVSVSFVEPTWQTSVSSSLYMVYSDDPGGVLSNQGSSLVPSGTVASSPRRLPRRSMRECPTSAWTCRPACLIHESHPLRWWPC